MRRNPRLSLVAGACMVVIAGCGGGSVSQTTEALLPIAASSTLAPSSTTAPPTTEASGLSAAERSTLDELIAAFAAADADAVLGLWTEQGEHFRSDIEFDMAIGGTWTDVSCALGGSGRPRCDLLYTNRLLLALDAPPLAGYISVEMTENAAIEWWVYDKGNQATTAAYIQPFSDWVNDTDPVAAQEMFDWNGFAFRNPRSQELWAVKVDEFLATLG